MAVIPLVEVESSTIRAIGHNAETNTLHVEFRRDDSIYEYENVDVELYKQLHGAESVGSFFAKNIKKFPEKYPYKKVWG